MPKNSKHVPPTLKVEVASGLGALPSGPEFDQLAPSEQSVGRGSTPVASKPRSTRRRARRNARFAARGDDPAARHPKWKRPNAQKSGVFAEPLILPGEDPREFEAIHSALIEEWTPSGLSEESKVSGMADAEWRKLRSRRFAQAKAISNSLNPAHPAFDEARGLITFGYLLCREPDTAFAECASTFLRADKIRHLNQKFLRQNFESIEEWAVASQKKSNQFYYQPREALLRSTRLSSILRQKHVVPRSLECSHSSRLFICANSLTMTLSNRSASTPELHD
jgi:hypothetical protein